MKNALKTLLKIVAPLLLAASVTGCSTTSLISGGTSFDKLAITSIRKTSSDGDSDTYTISFSDGTTNTFKVKNGKDGEPGDAGADGIDGQDVNVQIGANGNWIINGVDSGIRAKAYDGVDGIDGEDGKCFYQGNGAPSEELGAVGDYYIDSNSNNLYVKTAEGWTFDATIKGKSGKDGDDGVDGVELIPVIFRDVDGNTLYEYYCEKGDTAVFNGDLPSTFTKNSRVYGFTGWDKPLENIQEPTIFTMKLDVVDFDYSHGSYPQTVIKDEALIAQLDQCEPMVDAPFIEYDGFCYIKYDGVGYIDKTGEEVSEGSHYYMCEPVLWDVLAGVSGAEGFFGLTHDIIDAHPFNKNAYEGDASGIYANNYVYGGLYDFTCGDYGINTMIGLIFSLCTETVYLYNSLMDFTPASCGLTTNPYSFDGTITDMFMTPSVQELGYIDSFSNQIYGTTKNAKVTDFAKARGCTANDSGYGSYWTRSPANTASNEAFIVNPEGVISTSVVNNTTIGLRPLVAFTVFGGLYDGEN